MMLIVDNRIRLVVRDTRRILHRDRMCCFDLILSMPAQQARKTTSKYMATIKSALFKHIRALVAVQRSQRLTA